MPKLVGKTFIICIATCVPNVPLDVHYQLVLWRYLVFSVKTGVQSQQVSVTGTQAHILFFELALEPNIGTSILLDLDSKWWKTLLKREVGFLNG
jgi:hypothetical protein